MTGISTRSLTCLIHDATRFCWLMRSMRRSAVCLLLNAQLAYTGRNSPADNVAVPSAEPSGTPDCASWCSIDFAAQHCEGAGAHRACDLCDYCIARAEQREYEMAHAPSPAPPPEDTLAALMAAASYAHISQTPVAVAATRGTGTAAPPPPVKTCSPWCDPIVTSSHCPDDRCASCAFCVAWSLELKYGKLRDSVAPSGSRDVALGCEQWCSADSAAAHCKDARCQGCAFSCDLEASCASWCDEQHMASHCGKDACFGCEYCLHSPPPSPPPHLLPSLLPPPTPPPPPAQRQQPLASLVRSDLLGETFGIGLATGLEYGAAEEGEQASQDPEEGVERVSSPLDPKAILRAGGVILSWAPPPAPCHALPSLHSSYRTANAPCASVTTSLIPVTTSSSPTTNLMDNSLRERPAGSLEAFGDVAGDAKDEIVEGALSPALFAGVAALVAIANCCACALLKAIRGNEYKSAPVEDASDDAGDGSDSDDAAGPMNDSVKRKNKRRQDRDARTSTSNELQEEEDWDDAS